MTEEEQQALQEQAKAGEEALKKLEAERRAKEGILGDQTKLKEELKRYKQQEEERERKRLEEEGRYQELLKAREDELKALQERITKTEQERVQDRLRNEFVSAATGRVHAPLQTWQVFASSVQDDNGTTKVMYQGLPMSLSEFFAKLPADRDYSWHCLPQKPSGMGSAPGAPAAADPTSNPYLPGGTVTARLMLEVEDPEQAAKLKAEAQRKMAQAQR